MQIFGSNSCKRDGKYRGRINAGFQQARNAPFHCKRFSSSWSSDNSNTRIDGGCNRVCGRSSD